MFAKFEKRYCNVDEWSEDNFVVVLFMSEFPGRLFRCMTKCLSFQHTVYVILPCVLGVVNVDPTLRHDDYRNEMRRVIGNEVRDLLGPDFPNKAVAQQNNL